MPRASAILALLLLLQTRGGSLGVSPRGKWRRNDAKGRNCDCVVSDNPHVKVGQWFEDYRDGSVELQAKLWLGHQRGAAASTSYVIPCDSDGEPLSLAEFLKHVVTE